MQTILTSGFEVEWAENIPTLPDGSIDIDRVQYLRRDFTDHDAALAFAEEALKRDGFGSVRVTPFDFEPYFPGCRTGHREYTADSEHVE